MKRFLTLLKVCDIAQKTCEFAHTTHAFFLRGIEKRMNKIINIYKLVIFVMSILSYKKFFSQFYLHSYSGIDNQYINPVTNPVANFFSYIILSLYFNRFVDSLLIR